MSAIVCSGVNYDPDCWHALLARLHCGLQPCAQAQVSNMLKIILNEMLTVSNVGVQAIWKDMEKSPQHRDLVNMDGPLEHLWRDMYVFGQNYPGVPDMAAVQYFLEPWLAMVS